MNCNKCMPACDGPAVYVVDFCGNEETYNVELDCDENVDVGMDMFIEQPPIYNYRAGNGIVINNKVISIDDLIIDCGTSTTNLWEV